MDPASSGRSQARCRHLGTLGASISSKAHPGAYDPRRPIIAGDKVLSWAYTEEFALTDSEAMATASARAAEFGIDPLPTGTGSALRLVAALLNAHAVAEVGTGTGVSGLWLLEGMHPEGILTTIDSEMEHQRAAKEAFAAAGVKPMRTRTISGRALEVLPRLADGAYDLVVLECDPAEVADYCEQGLRMLRTGGAIAVVGALWYDHVADPARRDESTVAMRELGRQLRGDERLITGLLPVGDGLLTAVKRG